MYANSRASKASMQGQNQKVPNANSGKGYAKAQNPENCEGEKTAVE